MSNAKQKWDQAKGRARKCWSQLTDEDFSEAGGSLDKLCGIIHKRVGESLDAVHAKIGYVSPK